MRDTIQEVFSSIQGEGPYVGFRQLFVRFSGCNLHCNYCDTSQQALPPRTARLEKMAASEIFQSAANPVDLNSLGDHCRKLLAQVPHHSVSFTGGEPLCHVPALLALAPKLPVKHYLETNGTLPEELSQVLSLMDIISMDIKLPTSTGENLFPLHREFLRVAAAKEVFVKIVVTAEATLDEFQEAVALIAAQDRAIPLILQPVTTPAGKNGCSKQKLWSFWNAAAQKLETVRMIPQVHLALGLL